VSVFLLLVGVGPRLDMVMRFRNALRLRAWMTLFVCWLEGMWCAFADLLLVALGGMCR
jgi:hypothetical protein